MISNDQYDIASTNEYPKESATENIMNLFYTRNEELQQFMNTMVTIMDLLYKIEWNLVTVTGAFNLFRKYQYTG
jgi:hypothetical protein